MPLIYITKPVWAIPSIPWMPAMPLSQWQGPKVTDHSFFSVLNKTIPSHRRSVVCFGCCFFSIQVVCCNGFLLVVRLKLHEAETDLPGAGRDREKPGADPGFWSGGPVEFWSQVWGALSPKFAQNCLKTAWLKKKSWGQGGPGPQAPWIR